MERQFILTMNILCLTHSYVRFRGDVLSDHILLLNRLLKEKGAQIHVLAPRDAELQKYEEIEGIPIERFTYAIGKYQRLAYRGNMQDIISSKISNKLIFASFFIAFMLRTLWRISRGSFDIIHAHWWIPSGYIASLTSHFFRIPLVITAHGTDVRLIEKSKILKIIARRTFRKANRIICVSEHVRNQIVKLAAIDDQNKIEIIPMPADESIFRPVPRNRKEGLSMLCIARFTPQKSLATLIEACFLLNQNIPNWTLRIVGEGPLERILREKAHDLGILSKVEIIHFVPKDELARYYNECDIFVLPSINEGFGLVLVEALLCKRPAVGADSGGIKDIIRNEVTGLLFKPGVAQDLADKIILLYRRPELSKRLSDAGYEFALASFSSRAIAQKHIDVYTSLMKSQPL
jgi:glycosyltransferase involved in cell wall biosynthesis